MVGIWVLEKDREGGALCGGCGEKDGLQSAAATKAAAATLSAIVAPLQVWKAAALLVGFNPAFAAPTGTAAPEAPAALVG